MTDRGDSLALDARVEEGRSTYRFRAPDGLHSTDAFRPAELSLLEHCWDRDLGRLLCPAANYGVVPIVLAGVADRVHATESSARAANCCRRNARENGSQVTVSVHAALNELDERFDAVAYAPKPYTPLAIGKQRLADALARLDPDGRLWLAGTDAAGLSRYRSWLTEHCPAVETVTTAGDCEVVLATKPERYDPPTVVTPRTFRPTVDGVALPLRSVPGCFAAGGLDDGTRLLLEATAVGDGDRVLDLCCGYGPIGVYAGLSADVDLWLTDDDAVATRCAAWSLRAAGVDGTVVTADGVSGVADQRFDQVLCNPPTHAGSGVLADVLGGARQVLTPDGRLDLVHHRTLDLSEHLRGYRRVERRRTVGEHTVVRARP